MKRSSSTSTSTAFQFNTTPIVVGAVLIGAGTMMGLAGMVVGGTAMASATRKWFRELEMPPTEVVKQKVSQTKAATIAGASAWQAHNGGVHAHSSR
jgi:4-hydroxy-3-methylbut-2-en-1-yl diphosphate synthase IspG/GcpE